MDRTPKSLLVRTLVSVLMIVALVATIWLVFTLKPPGESGLVIIFFVMFAAALGGSIDLSFRTVRLVEGHRLAPVAINVVWKLLVSMALAVTAYVLFQSGIVQGSLFPKFAAVEDDYKDMLDYMNTVKPLHNMDTAKTLVWSFVAGYSERFVPDMLSRVRGQGEQEA